MPRCKQQASRPPLTNDQMPGFVGTYELWAMRNRSHALPSINECLSSERAQWTAQVSRAYTDLPVAQPDNPRHIAKDDRRLMQAANLGAVGQQSETPWIDLVSRYQGRKFWYGPTAFAMAQRNMEARISIPQVYSTMECIPSGPGPSVERSTRVLGVRPRDSIPYKKILPQRRPIPQPIAVLRLSQSTKMPKVIEPTVLMPWAIMPFTINL